MLERINALIKEAVAYEAKTKEDIENFRLKYLSRKGQLNELFDEFKLVPNEMKKFNEYKVFIIKQIVDKKLNCKEGLLLHGYKSDKEALELRNKYCK